MLRIVLDTNIYISAIRFGGNPEQILDSGRKRETEILVSEEILGETAKVLRKKFEFNDLQIDETLREIRHIAYLTTPKNTIKIIKEDEPDNRVLECAFEGNADYIVSGDRHLLSLKEYQGIKILRPKDFLNIFLSNLEESSPST
jgi:putative PIN family toxin of toxin-antitoxin system